MPFPRKSLGRALAAAAVALPAAALAHAGCASLLGDDFEIVEAGGGAASGSGSPTGAGAEGGGTTTGGGGPGGGGGGGKPALPFACAWAQSQHTLVDSTADDPQSSWGNFHAVRIGESGMRLVNESWGQGTKVQLRALGQGMPQKSEHSAGRLLDAGRMNAAMMAVLYWEQVPPGAPNLEMLVVKDGDLPGASPATVFIATLDDASPNGSTDGRFAARPNAPGDYDVDVAVAYPNGAGHYQSKYLHYAAGALVEQLVLDAPDATLTSGDVEPIEVVRLADVQKSLVFVGRSFSGKGPRVFDVSTGAKTPPSHAIGPTTTFLIDVLSTAEGTHVAMVDLATMMDATLRVGTKASGELYALDWAGLVTAEVLPLVSDLPVYQARVAWVGGILAFVGSSQNDPLSIGWRLYDAAGKLRGSGKLPFNASPPAGTVRQKIEEVTFVERDDGFDTFGGRIHVAWAERHKAPTGMEHAVLYYDQLECTPKAP
jgi:hypothetical protein